MGTINELLGPQAFTPVAAHWFAAVSSSNVTSTDEDGTTDYFAASTTTSDGTAPTEATLTRTRLDFFGTVIAGTTPIITYDTGSPFAIVADRVSPANEDVFFTAQTPGAAVGTSDIDVQRYDAFGNVMGSPQTLVSGVVGFEQLRVGSAATYGQRYFVAYSTFNAATGAEQIKLLSYSTDNRLIGNTTLDSFTTGNGAPDPFGFGSLDTSFPAETSIYLAGYEENGSFGVRYQMVDDEGALKGLAEFVAPLYPAGSSNRDIGAWAWTRLEGGSGSGLDLAVVMPYSDTDTTGTHYALDVRLIDTANGSAVDDTIALARTSDTHVTLARLPDGGLVVGYTDNGTAYLRDYDAQGVVVATRSFALPAAVDAFTITSLGDGRILIEYPQAVANGSQLVSAIDDTRQTGVTLSNYGDQHGGLAGTIYNDAFLITGFFYPDAIVGGGGTDFIITNTAAGTGTVLADLKDGTVSKGGQLDATISGITGVTTGNDPTVVLGLIAGVDLIYGGSGDLSFYNEGATDYISGGSGFNSVVAGLGNTIFYGTGGNDTMRGGSAASFMQAGPTTASRDTFYGNGGSDFVHGGPGTTVLYGSSGTEDLTGGVGTSELVGSTTSAGATNILNGGAGTDLFYAGIGTNLLYEATGTDTIVGTSGVDEVFGGAGRSFVYGGAGTDVVTTGAGNQYVMAGSGSTFFNDTAAHLSAGRFDQIDNFAGGKGTDLYLPAAVKGATSVVAQNGGTAVLTAVAGGTAEIFASNTSVATVQAHVHFTL